MKKQDFMSVVRRGIENKSLDELRRLCLEFARLVPLDRIEEAMMSFKRRDAVAQQSTPLDLTVAVDELFKRISNGDYRLEWDYDGGYYDGYHGEYYEDEETIADIDGLGADIQALLETAMDYVKEKRYSEALSAFDKLFSLAIPVEEYDDIDIDTLFVDDLITLDIDVVLQHHAYAVVMALRGCERVEKLYDVVEFSYNTYHELDIQEMARIGEDDIPDHGEFEERWIEFLLAKDSPKANAGIVIDAVLFKGGIDALHSFTLEHGAKYHDSYVRLSEMYIAAQEYPKAVSVIQDGFSKMAGVNRTRTHIANLLLEIGFATDDQCLIEKAVWEGFRSALALPHFINVCNLGTEDMKTAAKEYLEEHIKEAVDCNYIRFLCGDYESVYDACVTDKTQLGWSVSEKGRMIPLFITLLANKKTLSPCTKKLIE
jgi:tetratricopeptide (TPR) repeat protein